MDIDTVEATLSFDQLLTQLRESYTEIKRNLKRMRKAKGTDKVAALEKAFKFMRNAEASVKKLTAKGMIEASLISKNISAQISGLTITDRQQINQIETMFDGINRILGDVEKDSLIESRKSGNLVTMNRQLRKNIQGEKNKSVAIARGKIAVNDNIADRYRKAA